MKLVLGKWATDRVAAGTAPEFAAREAISYLHNRLGGHGGIILLGPDGRFGMAHNTPAMAWGLATANGLETGLKISRNRWRPSRCCSEKSARGDLASVVDRDRHERRYQMHCRTASSNRDQIQSERRKPWPTSNLPRELEFGTKCSLARLKSRTARHDWSDPPRGILRTHLFRQLPLQPRICHAKAFTFGIALRIASRLRHHHREVTSVFGGIAHAFLQQRPLQSATTHFGNGRCTAEQGNTFMQGQRASGPRRAIDLRQKAWASFARRDKNTRFPNEVLKLGMLMRPAARIDVAPQLRFVRSDDANTDAGFSGPPSVIRPHDKARC